MSEQRQTLPSAPVVTAVSNAQEVDAVINYIRTIKETNPVHLAQKEAERIAPYFHRMSAYLKSALPAHPAYDTPRLRALIEPQALRGLFNKVAKHYKRAMISETMILPDSDALLERMKVKHLSFKYAYKQRNYSFGFFSTQYTTLPYITLDSSMMNRIAPFNSISMLRALQSVMNTGNHDMLHHFTIETVNSNIINTKNFRALALNWTYVHFTSDSKVADYEGWANIAHKRIMAMPVSGVRGTDSLKEQVDIYMDELARIKSEMTTPDHDTVDYFGTMMAYTLMRVLPLDHPVMDHCIARMRALDPQPDMVVQDAIDLLSNIKGIATRTILAPVVEAYKKSPSALKLSLRGNATYEQAKRLQLAMITPELSYTICPESGTHKTLAEGRAKNAEASLDMVSTVAYFCKYSHDPAFPLKPYQKLQKLFGFGIGAQPRHEPAPA